jgi:hypothetical protein
MRPRDIFKPRIVLGTPITPKRILESLAGSSFCVSHYRPDDLEDAIRLVGQDEILLLDNGAFSYWRKGGRICRREFWTWANEIQRRSPQAVAVIPDVIGGDELENLVELSWALREGWAEFPERTMAIWHMDESLDQLAKFCRLVNFVGIGSCQEFDIQRRRPAFRARILEASQVIDQVEREHNRRPWIHLMRGLGIYNELARFDSADSTNVAVNHSRYKAEHGDDRGRYLADRVTEKVLGGLDESQVETVTSSITNFAEAPSLRASLNLNL